MLFEGDFETGDVYLNGKWLDPKNVSGWLPHRASGFTWGSRQPGALLLALAILREFTPMGQAMALYPRFVTDHVGTWPAKDHVTYVDVRGWIKQAFVEM